ncbi:hypothetical protein AB0N73_13955 [Microbacterium sp. NPDC089189]|uniref:hypothetical protein n=1 Tax=Microbacterium sp. NPDC089189 TaxID=3154972 RepID=UPI003443ADF7
MNIALLIIIVVAIVLAIIGGIGQGLEFLLWTAIIIGLIALIAFLIRVVRGNSRA